MHADSITAWATLILALGTLLLAFFTFRLATAADDSRRADWRPVLIPATDMIEEWDDEFRIRLKNVGRGPALGVAGQLRINGPSGASRLGEPSICEADAIIDLVFKINGEHPPGVVRRMEISYYDIGEWLHITDLTGSPLKAEEGGGFRLASTIFVGEEGRQLPAIFGSRAARARARNPRERAKALLRR